MIIGTAGHIDHGKTSLVKALTGVDTDRLKEEKARGITIDLGFAYQAGAHGQVLGFIDVPGHEKLVRNMLAGATGIDHVLLVVAADDGPMPQTREHLAILDLLGLRQGVVALTKVDLVSDERLAQAQAEVRSMLAPTGLAQAPVLPVSATTGAGIAALQQHLQRASEEHGAAISQSAPPEQAEQAGQAGQADQAYRTRRSGHFRLAVDRSFSLPGIGTVVTGTAVAGAVKVGDRLCISPSGIEVRVRGLHAQNQGAEAGHAGQRLALNLVGVEKAEVQRGDWVIDAALHAPTQRFDARVRLLASEARALAHWTPVHLHLGAVDVGARVVMLQGEPLAPGGSALVQLELDRPIGALHGDRFILRDQSATRTLGGGTVLDAFAPLARRRKSARALAVAAWEQPAAGSALAALLALQLPGGIDLNAFNTQWNLLPAEISALAAAAPHRAINDGKTQLAFAKAQIDDLVGRITQTLQQHHRRAPDSPGLTQEQLSNALGKASARPTAAVFELLLRELTRGGNLQRHGPYLRLAGHETSLQGAEKALWEKLKPWLGEGGWHAPPKLSDMLARDRSLHREQVTRLLNKQARSGQVFAVGVEYFILPPHLSQLAQAAQALAAADPNQRLNVKTLRESTGISRHLSTPLVEFFDHIGFTKRDAVGRKIRRDALQMFGSSSGPN